MKKLIRIIWNISIRLSFQRNECAIIHEQMSAIYKVSQFVFTHSIDKLQLEQRNKESMYTNNLKINL